jgi:hypothetical protein
MCLFVYGVVFLDIPIDDIPVGMENWKFLTENISWS